MSQIENKIPVQITENALKELKRIMSKENLEDSPYLRIGVKGGGCSGMSYQLGFDKKEEGDEQYEYEGIPVIIKTAHRLYLDNMQIGFSSGLDARGFIFENPNASSTCGCGTSFAV